MNTQERHLVTGLLVLMLLLWAGFVWHRDPAFPGSFTGGMLGIAAAAFMFVPFVYLVIKRIKPLKKWVTRRVSMPKLLLWHIYAGIIGPILGLLHSAHRFDSTVGIALILLMFIVVISGFVGRYLLGHISSGIRAKTVLRNDLYQEFQQASSTLCDQDQCDHVTRLTNTHPSLLPAMSLAGWHERSIGDSPAEKIPRLVDALSDIDYSIAMHDIIKRWFKRWLKFHIVISCTLYALLIFHIAAEIYFGLRWL
tara:strand:+ start:11080 stop:11835 length:756 start_codon:yes stop_codon:yes gene_type:complete